MGALEYVVQGEVQLRRGSLMRIADGAGMLVYVWRGTLWITEEGDPQDHFVHAGGWFRLRRAGTALLSALEPSVLSLTSPRESRPAGDIALLRPGSGRLEPLPA